MSNIFGAVRQKTIQGKETQVGASKETFEDLTGNTEESIPEYIKAPWEKVISKGNSYIVLGKDRQGSLDSGYGGRIINATEASSIDIVVGRHGPSHIENAEGEKEKNNVHPNFERDAARIYISQKTDIDVVMNLVPGKTNEAMAGMNSSIAKSAIGLIADEIRLSSRGGVKIVTTHSERSHGAFNKAFKKGVDLIAGNDDRDLQPMVKGRNLLVCLDDIIDQINDLNGIVANLIKNQMQLQVLLTSHVHVSGPPPLTGPSIEVVVGGTTKNINDVLSMVDLGLQKGNIALNKINYFMPFSANYILSRYHHLN